MRRGTSECRDLRATKAPHTAAKLVRRGTAIRRSSSTSKAARLRLTVEEPDTHAGWEFRRHSRQGHIRVSLRKERSPRFWTHEGFRMSGRGGTVQSWSTLVQVTVS